MLFINFGLQACATPLMGAVCHAVSSRCRNSASPVQSLTSLLYSRERGGKGKKNGGGGTAVIDTPPRTRFVEEAESARYAKKADRIAVHHRLGEVVAFIELVSPGNKGSQHALRAFVEKGAEFLEQGIHLLVVDLFPPSKRDPQGIHRAIWEQISETKFKLPRNKPLTLVSYSSGLVKKAYVEPVAVGEVMPDMPLFLAPEQHICTPLEATYQATWGALPEEIKELFE